MSIFQNTTALAAQAITRQFSKKISVNAAGYSELLGQISAINDTQAIVHFAVDGSILEANALFQNLMGYHIDEILGKHHRILVAPKLAQSKEYAVFWEKLRAGEAQQGAMLRIKKDGKDIWLRSSYTPIRDEHGHVYKIIKYAVDITGQLLLNYDCEGQIKAIRASQSVLQFDPDGVIIEANAIFLNAMGYELNEILGQHQKMFFDKTFVNSENFGALWKKLTRAEAAVGDFKLLTKSGKELWLQASFNPFLNHHGAVQKIVMYGADFTEQKLVNDDYQEQIEGINASQAVIHFLPDGTIVDANPNFLRTIGYNLQEIQGQHHRMFIRKEFHSNPEYLQFWPKLARGEAQTGEYRHITKEGAYIWIQSTYVPIKNSSGEVLKVVEYCTDITQQKDTVMEISRLIEAAKAGKLDERANIGTSDGDNKKLREDINEMLNGFTAPLQEISRVMKAVADKNLTQDMQGTYQGELGELKDYVNTAIAQLRESMQKVQATATIVNSSVQEIAAGNAELSVRTEQQASSLEETAAAMEEMTATVQQTAANAKLANDLAVEARNSAESGQEVVQKAVTAMTEITTSSNKISSIIEVINSIAFQTNLLALNAAVEAARAGDQGRGFAVVADEVRTLAGRSAGAAKEIKSLIDDSTRKVDEGSVLVNKTGQMLKTITTAVKKVSSVVEDIMAASNEQADGISSVNSAVQQMDDMTQQNSALVEEAAASSEALSTQSEELGKLIQAFKV